MASNVNLGQSVWNADDIINPVTTVFCVVIYVLPPARERIKNTYCMGQRPFLYLYFIFYFHILCYMCILYFVENITV